MKICLTLFALTIVTVCDGALIEGLLETAQEVNRKVHNVASSILSSVAENIRPKQDRPYQNTNGNPNGNQNLNIYFKDMQFNNQQQPYGNPNSQYGNPNSQYENPNSQYGNPNNQQASHSNQPGNQDPFDNVYNNLPAYLTRHPSQNTPNNPGNILENVANMHNKNPVNDNAVNTLKDTNSDNDRPLFVPIKNPVYSGYETDVNGLKRDTKDKSTPKPADDDEDLPIDIRFLSA